MNKKKKIIVILVILLLVSSGCGIAAWLLPLGKFRGTIIRFSIIGLLAAIAFCAGLIKGR